MSRATALGLALLLVTAALAAVLVAVPTSVRAQEPEPIGKVLYFQNATNANGEFVMNTSHPASFDGTAYELTFTETPFSFSVFIDPLLAGDLRMNGSFLVLLWVRQVSAPGATNFIDFSFDIYEVDAAGTRLNLLVDSPVTSHLDITTHYSEYTFGAEIDPSVLAAAGNGLEIVITMESNESNTKHVSWGSEEFPSRLVAGAVDRIRVADVALLNETGEEPTFFAQDDNVTINATVTDPFGGYDVVWVNATLVAPDGSLVLEHEPMALTSGNDTSFTKTFELVWADDTKLRGTYNLTVEAVDRTGFHFRFPDRPGDETYGGHLETLTVSFAVGEIVFANFRVVDGDGAALAGAELVIYESTVAVARATTTAAGRANVTLPGAGDYTAEVWWQDVVVLQQIVSVPGNVDEADAILLVAAVFSPTFRVVDVAFEPLGDAAIYLTHPNGTTTFRPFTADADGRLALTQMAHGTYTLRILWSGVEVALTDVAVGATQEYVVVANVFYLTVAATDADNATVPSVHIVVRDPARALVADSRLTDADGVTVSRLPIGRYDVSATWFGVPVGGADDVDLDGNVSLALELSIFTVTIRAVDERGVGLENAVVAVEIAAFQVSGQADLQGRTTFKLPAGNLSVTVTWRGVLVYDALEAVSADRTDITVQAAVHYVTLRAVDKDGAPLAGVSVSLLRDGVPVDGGTTDGNGTVEFRQPVGTYTVVARLQTTYLLTPVDQTVEQTVAFPATGQPVEIVFEAFPIPFTTTNLFYVLLGLLALVGAVVGLWWKLLRKRGPEMPEPPEEPPAEPPEGDA